MIVGKIRKTFLVIIMALLSLGAYAAVDLNANFDLLLTKPPHDEFYFSDPLSANTGKPDSYPSSVVFPAVKLSEASLGYPSVQYIGITYDLETSSVLRVYCNSAANHNGAHRLELVGTTYGIDYKVEVFSTYADASSTANPAPDPMSTAPDDPRQPVYVFQGPNPEHTPTPLASESVEPLTLQTVYLKMTLTSPKNVEGEYVPYSEGSYAGFIIMELLPD